MDASVPRLRTADEPADDLNAHVWLAIRAIEVHSPPPAATPPRVVHRLHRATELPTDDSQALPFCADGDFARYFDALGSRPPALAVLRRLVLHIDTPLEAPERVALYRNLWHLLRASPAPLRSRAARLFDERHAGLVGWGDLPWSHPLTHRRLAQAHLPGVSAERLEWQGPPDAAFVVALLSGTAAPSDEVGDAPTPVAADHRVGTAAGACDGNRDGDGDGDGTAARSALDDNPPTTLDPHSMLIGLQACLQGMSWASLDDRRLADIWRHAALEVRNADASLHQDASRTLFMLALAQGDDPAAVDALADCIRHQAHLELVPTMLRRWLEADASEPAESPLQLSPALQARWCRPQALHSASFRAALAGALRRPAIVARLTALERRLADVPPQPLDLEDRVAAHVLRQLSRLDGTWQRLAEHRRLGRQAASLLHSGFLGDEAVVVLQRQLAVAAIEAGDAHAANIALAAARAAGCPQSSGLLQQLLESLDPAAWQAATDTTGSQWWHVAAGAAPALGTGWQAEEPIWLQLARHGSPVIASIAAYQLAVLYTDGRLQPCTGARRSAALLALGLWTELRAEPAYEAEALRRLDSPAMRAAAAHGFQQDGLDWLCVPAADAGADRLLIVFTDHDHRHGFDSLELVNGFPGHHLLFLHDPAGDDGSGHGGRSDQRAREARDTSGPHEAHGTHGAHGAHGARPGHDDRTGYGGEAFERLRTLVQAHVDSTFDPSRVTCHGSGRGAVGALKMALHFGFQAVVANVANAAMQGGADDFTEHPTAAFERSPVCLRVGARPADREAFALWLAQARRCSDARFIVEKFDDEADDAGRSHLLQRVASRRHWPSALSSTIDRLAALRQLGLADDRDRGPGDTDLATIERSHAEVPTALLARFWDRLDEAPRLKLEIVVAAGRVFVADSLRIGTSPSAP